MSASGTALASLVQQLATAVAPEPVVVDDGRLDHPAEADTVVRPLALTRVGRSRRDGPVLDLLLFVEVSTRGPRALDLLERHLLTLERTGAQVVPDGWGDARAVDQTLGAGTGGGVATAGPRSAGLRIVVGVPVVLPLDEPQPPLVTHLPVVRVTAVSVVEGILLDVDGRCIKGALVRSSQTGATSVSDRHGRFRVLTPGGPTRLEVRVRDHVEQVDVDLRASVGGSTREVRVVVPGLLRPDVTVAATVATPTSDHSEPTGGDGEH